MNYSTILLVLFFAFTEGKVDFNIYEGECIQEMNANKNEMLEAFNRDLFPEDNQMFKDVLSCAWKKEGIIDEEGNFVHDSFRRFLINNFRKEQESNHLINLIAALVAADTINHCKNIIGDSAGDTAVKMSNCISRRLDSYDD